MRRCTLTVFPARASAFENHHRVSFFASGLRLAFTLAMWLKPRNEWS